MYAKVIGITVVLAALAVSHFSVYLNGRSDEAKASQAFAIQVHQENVRETKKKQKRNDELARKLNEKTIASNKNETKLKAELRRVHMERRSENDCIRTPVINPDNLRKRVLLIQRAISDSSGLDNRDNPAIPIRESYEIEQYCVSAIYEYNRLAEKHNGLISIVE